MSKQLSIEELISRSAEIHGTKYDYSLVNYVNKDTKVKIICQIHGIFLQSFAAHIRKKCGYPSCSIKKKLTTEEFINKCKLKHGNLYDYSLVKYENNRTPIRIICSKHGEFLQRPANHLNGQGCQKCIFTYNPETTEFIDTASKLHNNKYNYSLVKYKNLSTKVEIICSIHGIFEQSPTNHLKGCGCQKCSESHGEKLIRKFLTENNLLFIHQHRFKDCRDKNPLPFDLYLPELNTCIEFDGIQHYEPVDRFCGESELLNVQRKDNIKTHYCLDNGIKLIRIRYDEDINEKLELILYNYIKFTSSTKN